LDVRKITAGKLTDLHLLADISKNDENITVRLSALENLSKIAQDDKDEKTG